MADAFADLIAALSSGEGMSDGRKTLNLALAVNVEFVTGPDGRVTLTGSPRVAYMGADAGDLPGGKVTPNGKAVAMPATLTLGTLCEGFATVYLAKRGPAVTASKPRAPKA